MNQNEIQDKIKNEILKCQNSPYYFATEYIMIKNHRGVNVPFTTPLRENDSNKMVER